MGNHKSDQYTNQTALPIVMNGPDVYGRLARRFFSFTTPTATVLLNDTVQLVTVPAGARLLGGKLAWEAMAGTAELELGDGSTTDKYLTSTAIVAAGEASFGDEIATFFGEALTSELILTAKAVVGAWAAGKKLYGHVDYLIDG